VGQLLVYVATALVALVVLLTRLRLREPGPHAGRFVPLLHVTAGIIGLVVWILFLLLPLSSPLGSSLAGVVGLFFLWLVVVAGIFLMVRWLPSRGKHAGGAAGRRGPSGPAVSIVAHLGTLVLVVWLTWAYVTAIV